MDKAIEVKDLIKSFKDTTVLKGVDFEVQRGEILALLGSNGAGKTTTVKILSTLLRPDGGTASVCGFDVERQPDKVRQSISLTGQFSAVDGVLTGRENLVLIAKLRNISDPAQVADSLLERFGLRDAGGRRAGTYSGGMTRRLDIAMSLVGTPPVIFLDEPTTGLDPEGRREVWRTVKELAGSGVTILLTTQHLEEAEQLADKIAILHGGKIIANGTLEELKKLFPPARVEYIEKQPSLEEIFLAIIGNRKIAGKKESARYENKTGVLFGRSMRHILRSPDTIITVALVPIMMMLLFVFVYGGAIKTSMDPNTNYVSYMLPGILLMAIASGIAYTSLRLFMDIQGGLFARFSTMPIKRASMLWGHVLTSLVSNAISVALIILIALVIGFRSGAGILSWLAVTGILTLFTLALTWVAVLPGLTAKSMEGATAYSYPLIFLPFISSAFPRPKQCLPPSAPLPKISLYLPSSKRCARFSARSLSATRYGSPLRGVPVFL